MNTLLSWDAAVAPLRSLMRGKKRPLSERTAALAVVAVEGIPAASERTGIPQTTIREWLDDPEFVELRQRTKELATEEWWGIVQDAFRRSRELLKQTDDPVKAATAGAIVFDKMALASGDVTARTDVRAWTDGLDPDKQRRLRDWALDRLDDLDRRANVPNSTTEGTGVRE